MTILPFRPAGPAATEPTQPGALAAMRDYLDRVHPSRRHGATPEAALPDGDHMLAWLWERGFQVVRLLAPAAPATISYLTGTTLGPIKYHIDSIRIARWWPMSARVDFLLVTEFMTLGGFKTRAEAHAAGRACGFEWRGGL